MTTSTLAQQLETEGVGGPSPSDGSTESMAELNPNLTLEHATARAVLFVTDQDEETWIPKAALRVDDPIVLVMPWFINRNGDELPDGVLEE